MGASLSAPVQGCPFWESYPSHEFPVFCFVFVFPPQDQYYNINITSDFKIKKPKPN